MFTCISCRIAFESAEEQRSHFGTDWHRYNMKRRVANLPPVSATAFNHTVIERREQNAVRPDPRDMTCTTCNKAFSSENSYRSHVQSKKHKEREVAVVRAGGLKALHKPVSQVDPNDRETDDDEMDSDDEPDIDQAIAASRRRLGPGDCLFCTNRTADLATNISHMSAVHSFFIPDQDLLVDLPGLIAYLGEKIATGNLCIFCPDGGKEFGSVDAVRKHMIDKSHCKIAYETDEDRAELADYYDFMGEDDTSDWEDLEEDDGDSNLPSLASDGLSLILPSGRVLGHRSLKVYYTQHLRPSHGGEADPMQSKIALVRQRLADPSSALVPVAGGHGSYGRGLEVVKARNAGEANWAKKQGRSFKDQRVREDFKTKVAFKNNNQKHFRDPLLQ